MVWLNKEKYAEYITDEILKRLDLSSLQGSLASKSLVIIDESPFGNEKDISEQIRQIHKKDGISEVICIDDNNWCSFIKGCGFNVLKVSSLGSGIYRFIDSAESVYILNFTISNASRICMLSDDNPVCKAVQYSLMNGKKVFVSDLCFGYDCTKVNNTYLDRIKSFANQLGSYGIGIIPSLHELFPEQKSKVAAVNKDDTVKAAKKVICLEDIKDCNSVVLEIGSNSIVTPLAQEYIRDRKIKITTI